MGGISRLPKDSARCKSEIHSKLYVIDVGAKWNPLWYLTHISVHYTRVRTTPIDKPLYLLKISINAHIYSTHPPISIPIPTLHVPHSNVGIPCITWTPLLPGRTLLVVHAPSHDPPVTKATEPASDQSQSRRYSAGDLIFLCSSFLLLGSRVYSGRASASRDTKTIVTKLTRLTVTVKGLVALGLSRWQENPKV